DTSSAEAEIDAAPFVAHVGSAAQALDDVGDEEVATASAGEGTTVVGAEDIEEFVDGGEGDAAEGVGIEGPPADRVVTAGSREAAEEGGAVPEPGHDTTATALPDIDN
ncbi:unnamed protein product, partial [Ectocarpus fasciculatus]